jgi:hypothetical protein
MKQSIKLLIATIIIIGIFSSWTNKTTNECRILHKGTFKYGDSETEIIVKIKGKKHTEYHDNKKYVIESKLEWVNDCEYNMIMKKVTIPDFPYGPGDIMNVKIKSVEGKVIYYTSTVNGQSWNGKLIKIG